jgi:hypothetical protein
MNMSLGKAGVALVVGGVLGAGTAAGFGVASALSSSPAATFASSSPGADLDLAALDPTAAGLAAPDQAAPDQVLPDQAAANNNPRGKRAHPLGGPYPGLRRLLAGRVEHGEVTIKGKDNKPVVVDVQRGQVTAVSPTSISLKSEDGFTATYTVSSDTRVRVGGERKAIGDVRVGNNAGLIATKASAAGSSAAAARLVVVR